ncbi:MAG: hypothetical protein ACI35P_15640 [Bacillus sp. (in: firmicutes)]
MPEDKFIFDKSDDITQIITERLGERQRKLDKMAEWESEALKYHKYRRVSVRSAIAACLLIGLVLTHTLWQKESPLKKLGINNPTITEFRAAYPEMKTINRMISYNKLDSALCLTEKVLMESDLHIYELEEQNRDVEDEELLYETELQKSLNSELRWIYIYLLVKTERNNEARNQIEIYLANKKYCEHEKEASALFEEITK